MDEVKRWDLNQLARFIAIEHPEEEPEEAPKEESEKGVATFDDIDLDEGLINKEADEVLDKFKLPLPSKLINRKLEDIQLFQKNTDKHVNDYKNLLPPTRAILYLEKGVNKAVEKSNDPKLETKRRVKYYNTLGQYISNLKSLEKYAKKKQDKVSSTSTTLINLLTDLNYLLAPSLLETMV